MWRGTGLPVKFLILDARSCLPILLAVVHWSWTTLIIGVLGTAFLAPFRFLGSPCLLPCGRRAAGSLAGDARQSRHGSDGDTHEHICFHRAG